MRCCYIHADRKNITTRQIQERAADEVETDKLICNTCGDVTGDKDIRPLANVDNTYDTRWVGARKLDKLAPYTPSGLPYPKPAPQVNAIDTIVEAELVFDNYIALQLLKGLDVEQMILGNSVNVSYEMNVEYASSYVPVTDETTMAIYSNFEVPNRLSVIPHSRRRIRRATDSFIVPVSMSYRDVWYCEQHNYDIRDKILYRSMRVGPQTDYRLSLEYQSNTDAQLSAEGCVTYYVIISKKLACGNVDIKIPYTLHSGFDIDYFSYGTHKIKLQYDKARAEYDCEAGLINMTDYALDDQYYMLWGRLSSVMCEVLKVTKPDCSVMRAEVYRSRKKKNMWLPSLYKPESYYHKIDGIGVVGVMYRGCIYCYVDGDRRKGVIVLPNRILVPTRNLNDKMYMKESPVNAAGWNNNKVYLTTAYSFNAEVAGKYIIPHDVISHGVYKEPTRTMDKSRSCEEVVRNLAVYNGYIMYKKLMDSGTDVSNIPATCKVTNGWRTIDVNIDGYVAMSNDGRALCKIKDHSSIELVVYAGRYMYNQHDNHICTCNEDIDPGVYTVLLREVGDMQIIGHERLFGTVVKPRPDRNTANNNTTISNEIMKMYGTYVASEAQLVVMMIMKCCYANNERCRSVAVNVMQVVPLPRYYCVSLVGKYKDNHYYDIGIPEVVMVYVASTEDEASRLLENTKATQWSEDINDIYRHIDDGTDSVYVGDPHNITISSNCVCVMSNCSEYFDYIKNNNRCYAIGIVAQSPGTQCTFDTIKNNGEPMAKYSYTYTSEPTDTRTIEFENVLGYSITATDNTKLREYIT